MQQTSCQSHLQFGHISANFVAIFPFRHPFGRIFPENVSVCRSEHPFERIFGKNASVCQFRHPFERISPKNVAISRSGHPFAADEWRKSKKRHQKRQNNYRQWKMEKKKRLGKVKVT